MEPIRTTNVYSPGLRIIQSLIERYILLFRAGSTGPHFLDIYPSTMNLNGALICIALLAINHNYQ